MNIKQSIRIVFRNKTYSILNIAGLAIGIAASALILLWVEYHLNSNRSIPKREHLYMIGQNQYYGDEIRTFFVASSGLMDIFNHVAGIKRCTRYSDYNTTFRYEEKNVSFSESGAYVDSTLFTMIDLPFVAGNPKTAFAPAYPVVVSQKMARKIFGNVNPLGEALYMGDRIYEVSGVFKDREENGTFRFEWLIPCQILENDYIERGWITRGSWGNWTACFLELEPRADINVINENITTLFREAKSGWDERNEIFIYPVHRMHLYGEFKDGKPTGSGYIRTVRMFFAIGMAILLIGCINFMNLNTARSQKRAMEVGVRKTFGAKYLRLAGQFMGESAIITVVSLVVGVVLVLLALPSFNQLLSLHLAIDITNPYHSIGILAVGVLCTVLSGAYPAFYMSSFSPLRTLKKMKANLAGSAGMVRKGLVVFQFAISYVLICSTAIIYLQIRHVHNRSLGIDLNRLVLFNVVDEIRRNFESVQEALVNNGMVSHAGISSQQLITLGNNGGGYKWQGKAPNIDPLVYNVLISPGLMETAGIRFSDGKDFSWQLFGEKPEVIINRSFAELMGEEGRVGGFIERGGSEQKWQITGIVEDFVFNDYTRGKAEPVIFHPEIFDAGRLFVRLKQGVKEGEAIAAIQNTLLQFAPGASFEPSYMDEIFNRGFSGQRFTGKLSIIFSVLAVFLSCMGLFGLSAFAAEQRTKEIGIRKVLGATVWDIVYLLGRNFMYLLLISFVIAIPAAWYAGSMYLRDYGYRISLGWHIFAAACLLVFLIAMLTVSSQSLRAATENPLKAIKSE